MTWLFERPLLDTQTWIIAAIVILAGVGGVLAALYPIQAAIVVGFISCVLLLAHYQSFLLSGILFCGMATLFRDADVGPISAMGALTIYLALGSWALWIARRAWSRWVILVLSPWVLLIFWGGLSLSWSWAPSTGYQNLLVLAAFVGFMLLGAEYSRESEDYPEALLRVTVAATWVAAGLYLIQRVLYGADPNIAGIGARGFALLALVGVSCTLAQWRYGSIKGALTATGILSLVAYSLSRTALVSGMILFPFARLRPGKLSGWVSFLTWIGLGIGAFYILVTRVDALRTRFIEGDLDLEIAGIPINVEGRTSFWEATLASFWQAPWVGHGAGTAEQLIANISPISHPHNDYLRYLHDFGIVGFSLWLVGFLMLIAITFRYWTRSDSLNTSDAPVHLAAFLGLIAVASAMMTDNVIVYVFVMAPLGAIIGASLGRASLHSAGEPRDEAVPVERKG